MRGQRGGEIAFRPLVEEGDPEGGEEDADAEAEEEEACDSLAEGVGLLEDVGVAGEEAEEDDVDDGHVERE